MRRQHATAGSHSSLYSAGGGNAGSSSANPAPSDPHVQRSVASVYERLHAEVCLLSSQLSRHGPDSCPELASTPPSCTPSRSALSSMRCTLLCTPHACIQWHVSLQHAHAASLHPAGPSPSWPFIQAVVNPSTDRPYSSSERARPNQSPQRQPVQSRYAAGTERENEPPQLNGLKAARADIATIAAQEVQGCVGGCRDV